MAVSQEFHISVTPVGQNEYLVRTEQVAPGVPLAEELVTWPVADWLATARHLMNDPLNSVLQGDFFGLSGRESDIARNSINLISLGQEFYNALFQGTLRDSWITAQGISQNHQQILRLRLGLKDPKLARLPWEVMHAGDRPIATGPYIAFSRYQTGITTVSRLPSRNVPILQETDGVKVLMVIASPTDQVRLNLLKQEAIQLQAELCRPISRSIESGNRPPEIELTLLDQPSREELTQSLEQGRYHILHYSGHSNLGPGGGEIYLVSRRTGLTETLRGDDLAGLLVNNNIQMAVFNSCLGAYAAKSETDGDTGERNLTESLIKRGLRSVLAMSERIPDEVALTLTQLFYRNLSQGYPPDLCVSRVRQGLISAYGSHQMYWALPILYLQPDFKGFLSPETDPSATVEFLNEYHPQLESSTPLVSSGMLYDTDMDVADWLGEEFLGDITDETSSDPSYGEDEMYADPSYSEDAAFVRDVLSNLEPQQAATDESLMQAELIPRNRENALVDAEVPVIAWSKSDTRLPVSTPLPWKIFGVLGISVIAILCGFNWWWYSRTEIPPIPVQPISIPNQPSINLKTTTTGIVTAIATENLNRSNLSTGLAAVDELLNRGALPGAETALNVVGLKYIDDPSVNFLKGRLAWQCVQIGDKKYSVDDARRFWEIAVREQKNSILYQNALGFAYYAEGNLDAANDYWFKALDLALKANGRQLTSNSPPSAALTSYAGLALSLYKLANNQQSTSKRAQYINQAIGLCQLVVKKDPENFQIAKLAHNWLWTKNAIADWQSLLRQQGSAN